MCSYQDLLVQKAALARQQAELDRALTKARRGQGAGVIAQVKSLMAEHGLTVADLIGMAANGKAPDGRGKRASAGRKVAVKYRDPATGNSWTGRGIKPKWIQTALAEGSKLDDFLV